MLAFKPGIPLSPHVDTLWVTDGPLRTQATFAYYPVPTSDVLIVLDDHDCTLFHCSAAMGTGTVVASAGKSFFALRLRPGMGADLFGTSETRITDRNTELDTLFGMSADTWGQMLHEAPSAREQAKLLFRQLRKQNLDRVKPPRAQQAARMIEQCNGAVPIMNIAQDLALSPRQLKRQLKEFTGLTPKALARSVRLQSAFNRLHARCFPNLAHLAQDLGYTDQAHFIRDFKALTGATPGQFLRATRMAPHVTDLSATQVDTSRPIYHF